MTTRRIITSEKTILDKDDPDIKAAVAGKAGPSNTAPAVPAAVIYKLLGFTAAMVVLPIGTYYGTVNTIFNGSQTWAGATAAIMANVVLIAYVIVAMNEDETERIEEEKKRRKDI